LLEGITDSSDAMRVAGRIRAAVAEPFTIDGHEVRTSISVGIALSTTAHERAEDLLQEADVAMRRAKALGGSRCEMFDEAMHTRAVNQLKLEDELHQAVPRALSTDCSTKHQNDRWLRSIAALAASGARFNLAL
jgi:predicted signal transduction protein with EAL and GGDEF domain